MLESLIIKTVMSKKIEADNDKKIQPFVYFTHRRKKLYY
jgi:hypothetical protein